MTIIVFLVDTSGSMNQRAYAGGRPTLLDVAKNAVETFVKIRQRSPESRGDRYMLLTFDESPGHIKAGWKENLTTFMTELKNLQAVGMTTMGAALKNTFDLLNINRMQSGIDTFGQGRNPCYLEPSIILCITDGGKLSSASLVYEELLLPSHQMIPGSELCKDPFRWDQRLFSLVLRLTGSVPAERDPLSLVPSDHSPIDAMCEATGGRSYAISSQRMLIQCIDSLVQKIQCGVVLHFEKIGPDPPPVTPGPASSETLSSKDGAGLSKLETPDIVFEGDYSRSNKENLLNSANEVLESLKSGCGGASRPLSPMPYVLSSSNVSWHSCKRLIYVPRILPNKTLMVGHWPIPENFWPDVNAPSLPPRTAHPNVKFTCSNVEPMVIENLPFDKYELEPSPLTQYILARRQSHCCWQVYVSNSFRNSEVSHPFGYLKASTNLQCVNLFVMPYNYPVLLPLLDDLFKIHRLKPPKEWKAQFDSYLRNMPSYYAGPLRRALKLMGAPNLVPETLDTGLSYTVGNYLRKIKNQAKVEYERLCAEIGAKVKSGPIPSAPDAIRVLPRSPLKQALLSHPCLADKFSHLNEQVTEMPGFTLVVQMERVHLQSYRNPFDVSRNALLDQLARMRSNFLRGPLARNRLLDDDALHNMPVGQMGNYQEYLKRMPPPLRELESTPTRQHMFGNPFKIDKRMMVDEADIDLVGGPTSSSLSAEKRPGGSLKRPAPLPSLEGFLRPMAKRKPGPLPKDWVYHRPTSPSPIPSLPSSPCPTPPSPLPSPEEEELKPLIKNELPLFVPATPPTHFQPLFEILYSVKGSMGTRVKFAQDVKRESLRFKRKHLASLLEDFTKSLEKLRDVIETPKNSGR
ncbi:unnamed protein product [Darwinula stevensoni]|uniref:VWFA domain-containing protein n=1 Tax=Darwinula stevensoni TaxID=69355 RepID=A0A7R9A5L2_9CRUS|nr:unnamed protein product [Darwinula stevensoni]CAG0895776.1 unnamed protein product [Darwinula stevensoni]